MTLDTAMHAIGWIAIAGAGSTAIGIITSDIIPQWRRIVRLALGYHDLPRASGATPHRASRILSPAIEAERATTSETRRGL